MSSRIMYGQNSQLSCRYIFPIMVHFHQHPNYFHMMLYQSLVFNILSTQDGQCSVEIVLYIIWKVIQIIHLLSLYNVDENSVNKAKQVWIFFKVLSSEGISLLHTITKCSLSKSSALMVCLTHRCKSLKEFELL